MHIDWLEHQVRANAFLDNIYQRQNFAALFMETGTGKTPVALDRIEKWLSQGLKRVICIVPNNLRFNWIEEAKKFKCDFEIKQLKGGRLERTKLIESEWDVLVINYEGVRGFVDCLIHVKPDALVFDELHRVKNRSSKQTKASVKLAKTVKYRLGLTGTPVTQSPLDLWSQFNVLGSGWPKHPLHLGSYTSFRTLVADIAPHPNPRLGYKAPIYTYPEYKLTRLRQNVAPYVFQATKEECLDLPPRGWQNIYCEMGPEQKRVYRDMQREAISVVNEHLASVNLDSGISSANMILTQIGKLQQIACGFIKKDDGEIHELPNCKLDRLEEFLPELLYGNRKVCIWCRFRHDVDTVRDLLQRLQIGHVWVDGRNSFDIQKIVGDFRSESSTKVLVGQVQVVREGLNLVEANSVIYFSNSHNLEWRLQSQDRVYRYGQVNEVMYYDLIAKGTKDLAILENLMNKQHLARLTIDNLKAMLESDDE